MAALLALSRFHASAHSERPALPTGRAASVISHSRVDDSIEDIDDEIEDDGEDCNHHNGAHYERVIAVQCRVDKIAADARYLKDRLHDDRAGKQRCGSGTSVRD